MITTAHLSLNPRLVKEVKSLIEAGYNVQILYQYWNDWGSNLDKELIANEKWNVIRIGGDPISDKFTYWSSRLLYKAANKSIKLFGFGNGLAEFAIGRCTLLFTKKAKQIKADLYIAHNLAALPAAVIAAKKFNSKCGFDAEDLHRFEVSDDPHNKELKLKSFIEEKYFPMTDYLTTSSQEIAAKYNEIFPSLKFNTLLNVFPKTNIEANILQALPLKLFWFSQYVGLSRGIQDILSAMKILQSEQIEFHILGFLNESVKTDLTNFITKLEFTSQPKLLFHQPIPGEQLFNFAKQFDIGLATEPGFSINNNLALSNKIFTYIQSGMAVIASNTLAQENLLKEYPNMGTIYKKGDPKSLATALSTYLKQPDLLVKHKVQSTQYAATKLNWEDESQKFLAIIKNTIPS